MLYFLNNTKAKIALANFLFLVIKKNNKIFSLNFNNNLNKLNDFGAYFNLTYNVTD